MEPAMGIDRMAPALYKAAVEGKPEDYFKTQRENGVEDDGIQVMPNGNTVLHVATLRGHQQFVEKILQGKDNHTSSCLLFAQNKENQTALHCAAEKGYANIVSILIDKSKDIESGTTGVTSRRMIQMTDDVMDTALHKAVRMGHFEVVKLLVERETEFVYPANDAGETPIYITAKLRFRDCLEELLQTCKYPTYGGPGGQNALHAAVLPTIAGTFFKYTRRHDEAGQTECKELILKREISLCEMTDDSGWTPLHYAIKIHDNETARMILEENSRAAYICAGKGDEWMTILHITARYNNLEMMKYILNSCPDYWMTMVNSKCQNVLHEAVMGQGLSVIEYLLKHPQIDNLIYEKDEDGNTPFDLLSIHGSGLVKLRIMLGLMLKHLFFNKQHQTPSAMAIEHKKLAFSKYFSGGRKIFGRVAPTKNEKRKNTEEEENEIKGMIETGKTSIVVATLILTMTFAAGFAVPGGFNSEKGNPILLQNAAFQAFIISDSVSFVFSLSSIISHIVMVSEASSSRKYRIIRTMYSAQNGMLFYACVGVVVAFLCGMYAILAFSRGISVTFLALVIAYAVSNIFFIIVSKFADKFVVFTKM